DESSPSIRIQCGDGEELIASRADLVLSGGAYFSAMLERSRMSESLTGLVRLPDLQFGQVSEFLRAALHADYSESAGQIDRLWRLLRLAMRFQADQVLQGCCQRLADCAFGSEDEQQRKADPAEPAVPLACALARLSGCRVTGAAAALDRLLSRLAGADLSELAGSPAWLRCCRRSLHAEVLRRAAVDWPADWLAAASSWSGRHLESTSDFLIDCLRPTERPAGANIDASLAFQQRLLASRKSPPVLLTGHARAPRRASNFGLVEVGRLMPLRSADWTASTPCHVIESRDLQEMHGYCLLSIGDRWLIVGGENAYGRGMWVREVREFTTPPLSSELSATKPELGRLLAELPYPVRDHCVCTDGRRLFVAGGATTYRKLSNKVCYLDLETGTWTSLPPLPSRMYGLRSAAVDDLLIVYHCRTPHIVFCWDLRGPPGQMWTQLSAIDLLSFLYFNRKSTGEKALLIDFLQVKSFSFVGCGRHLLFAFDNAVRGPSPYPGAMAMHFGDFRTLLRCFLDHRAKPEPGGDPEAPFARFTGSREFRIDLLLVREADELARSAAATGTFLAGLASAAATLVTDNRDTVWMLEATESDAVRVTECHLSRRRNEVLSMESMVAPLDASTDGHTLATGINDGRLTLLPVAAAAGDDQVADGEPTQYDNDAVCLCDCPEHYGWELDSF
ncbi:hypothetical protein BOX15_Mlig020814g2, partial [Macrostomum lignano]